MRRLIGIATVWAAILGTPPISAAPYPEDDEQRHAPVFVADLFMNQDAAERAAQTDLKFSQNMTRHHQGAIDMARLYLNDSRGTNPILVRLAHGIIKNQQFEIGVLDVVSKQVSEGPRKVGGAYTLRRGREGMEHDVYFVKAAPPGVLDVMMTPGMKVSDFDVQFARPMIEHHSAALTMASDYNRNPEGRSSVIGPLNYELMQDQRAEIDLLKRIIARYHGESAKVPDDPQMMDAMRRSMSGMDGMQHSSGSMSHR